MILLAPYCMFPEKNTIFVALWQLAQLFLVIATSLFVDDTKKVIKCHIFDRNHLISCIKSFLKINIRSLQHICYHLSESEYSDTSALFVEQLMLKPSCIQILKASFLLQVFSQSSKWIKERLVYSCNIEGLINF